MLCKPGWTLCIEWRQLGGDLLRCLLISLSFYSSIYHRIPVSPLYQFLFLYPMPAPFSRLQLAAALIGEGTVCQLASSADSPRSLQNMTTIQTTLAPPRSLLSRVRYLHTSVAIQLLAQTFASAILIT
jgi:hypothetical protein